MTELRGPQKDFDRGKGRTADDIAPGTGWGILRQPGPLGTAKQQRGPQTHTGTRLMRTRRDDHGLDRPNAAAAIICPAKPRWMGHGGALAAGPRHAGPRHAGPIILRPSPAI